MIIYTCLIGDIDKLEDPIFPNEKFEYICFSDKPRKSSIWKIEPLIKKFNSSRLSARYHKTIVSSMLGDDNLWQDSKITFNSKIDFIKNQKLCLPTHPIRNCIYEEAKKVVELGKDFSFNVNKIIEKYKQEQYPKKNGLYETSLVLRSNCEEVKKINELWWEEIQICVRDQISLPYVLWKLNFKPELFNFNIFENKYLNIRHHKIKKKVIGFI